ncbi:TolC family protein [Variovorax ureilyticus]|uniref:TolC family protein n=1 Tax=Variovorax ureilyticus TaxID=1836198 RepID=A0ABU8VQM5_9BURK
MHKKLRSTAHAVAVLAGCLGAAVMAQTAPPSAPRTLEWGHFADGGPPGSSTPAIPAIPAIPASAAKPVAKPAERPPLAVAAPARASASLPPHVQADAMARPRMSEATRAFFQSTVSKALARSPEVREANAKWLAAESDISEAKGQRWPQVQLGVASPSATFGSGTNESARNAIGSVQVTTPVYDWGRISRTVESRTETSRAVHEQMMQVRQQVAFDTLNAVIELARNREAMTISNAYVDRMTELVDMLGEIVKADRGRASELTQARARRLQAVTSRDQVAAKLGEVEIDLMKLVGEKVTLPAGLQWGFGVVDVQDALQAAPEHPSLRQARAEAKAAELYAESVRASRRPQLNWVVSKSTQQDSLGRSQPWATGLSVQWNAFQGGSGTASERAAFERAAASEQKAVAATRDLEYRLRTSASQRDAALSRANDYTALIRDSNEVRAAFFEQWYHLGRRTLLDVLIAENDHYNQQIAQVNSRFDGEAADLRMRADAAILLTRLFGSTGDDVPSPL